MCIRTALVTRPLFGILLSWSMLSATATAAQSVVVVVNSANSVSALSKNQISAIFLKKIGQWDNHASISPVDQDRRSPVRNTFTNEFHGRSTALIETYWQTQIFSGKDYPPPTRRNDTEVLAFVRANPNAIGYVSAQTPLGTGVKAITVTESP